MKKYLKAFYEHMALNRMAEGNSLKALFWYKRLESLEGESRSVLHNIAVILISLKRYDEAEKYILKELELYRESSEICRVLGDLYYMWGNRKLASEFYGKALNFSEKSHSGDIKFLKSRINICKRDDLYSKAVESFDIYEQAQHFLKDKDYEQAYNMFLKVTELDKSNFMAFNEAGAILLNYKKDYNNALKFFKKAHELVDLPVIRVNITLAENFLKEAKR